MYFQKVKTCCCCNTVAHQSDGPWMVDMGIAAQCLQLSQHAILLGGWKHDKMFQYQHCFCVHHHHHLGARPRARRQLLVFIRVPQL